MAPNTQDITWLDEMESELDHRMVQYLTGHHEGYRTLLKEQSEILKQYPVITKLQEGTDGLHLTPKEHRMYFRYRSVQTEREALERKYFYLMGQADMVPYKQVLQGLSRKKERKRQPMIQHLNLESWQMELINHAVVEAEMQAKENCAEYEDINEQISTLYSKYPFIDRLLDRSKITKGKVFSAEELQGLSECLKLEADKRYIEEIELYLKGLRDGHALKKLLELK